MTVLTLSDLVKFYCICIKRIHDLKIFLKDTKKACFTWLSLQRGDFKDEHDLAPGLTGRME